MVCCIVDIKAENCAAITDAVAEAKDCDIEEGTVATDVDGVAVTSDATVLGGTPETTVVVAVVDILAQDSTE